MVPRRRIALACACIAVAASTALILFRDRAHDSPAATGAPESSTCLEIWQRGIELAGVVGGRESQAYFDTAPVTGGDRQLSGIVVYPRERTNTPLADAPVGLAGPRGSDACAVELTERDTDTSATWSLRIESTTRITGQRRLPGGASESILFTAVPETRCDGAGEWRMFSSADWPITFEYPASWPITADRDDITVECPSVTRLASGGEWLTFEQGRFVPRGVSARDESGSAYSEPFWFVRVGEDWRVSDKGCADPSSSAGESCRPARRSEHHGVTILQGEAGEHRLHRAGIGYLGAGPGITRYLFITGDRWVSLDASASSSHHQDIGREGGQVLLEGDGVADRVVRSIRPR
jgi:hypothetical protein